MKWLEEIRSKLRGANREVSEKWLRYFSTILSKGLRYSLWSVVVLLIILSFYWSREPPLFDVRTIELADVSPVTGTFTTVTLIRVIDHLVDKPGGYLSNDVMPPGLWLDNLPSWEFGVLVQVRDLSKAMREWFSRSQSQSTEDIDLALVEPRLNVDPKSWAVPWPEAEYAEGRDYLQNYLVRLADQRNHSAQFYARADNLRHWLGTVELRLGSLSQRLSASVGQRRINTDLSGTSGARQSTEAPDEWIVKTEWIHVDNVFYEARGTAWALLHFLNAIEIDFADTLANKKCHCQC
jgi:hypothetical protein